jgi:hypothetical protein
VVLDHTKRCLEFLGHDAVADATGVHAVGLGEGVRCHERRSHGLELQHRTRRLVEIGVGIDLVIDDDRPTSDDPVDRGEIVLG